MKVKHALAAGGMVVMGLMGVAGTSGCDKRPPEQSRPEEPFKRMNVEELDTRIKAAREGQGKLLIVDNNSESRFKEGHIPGAKWVKYSEVKAEDLPADKGTTLVFYCANEH
ncbi:MAG: rhodanese-like domain-containing protein [Myxococcota bacterium]